MDDNTTQLIEKLATKLGTTSEYLWGVLIKQAQVNIFIGTLEIAAMVALMYLYYRFCKFGAKAIKEENEFDIPAGIAMLMGGIVCVIFYVCIFYDLSEIATCIFNPEYWALKEVLNAVKGK